MSFLINEDCQTANHRNFHTSISMESNVALNTFSVMAKVSSLNYKKRVVSSGVLRSTARSIRCVSKCRSVYQSFSVIFLW